MSRSVFCRKYRRQLAGLEVPPLPGAAGADIFENISAVAWREWQHLQTMLINEHHLSMLEPQARRFLSEQMRKFFANEDYEQPAGYVPQADPEANP